MACPVHTPCGLSHCLMTRICQPHKLDEQTDKILAKLGLDADSISMLRNNRSMY